MVQVSQLVLMQHWRRAVAQFAQGIAPSWSGVSDLVCGRRPSASGKVSSYARKRPECGILVSNTEEFQWAPNRKRVRLGQNRGPLTLESDQPTLSTTTPLGAPAHLNLRI